MADGKTAQLIDQLSFAQVSADISYGSDTRAKLCYTNTELI